MLSWLVSRDPLPSLPATPHHGHEFLSWLSSREHLPSKSTGVTTAPRSFLRWLLTLDPHERLENRQPAKEVTPHEA
jgi:hypothetical protein